MKKTDFSRRLDSSGRIIIPARLRQELGMTEGETYDFYTLNHEGSVYLCIKCAEIADDLAQALQIARRHGMKIVRDNA